MKYVTYRYKIFQYYMQYLEQKLEFRVSLKLLKLNFQPMYTVGVELYGSIYTCWTMMTSVKNFFRYIMNSLILLVTKYRCQYWSSKYKNYKCCCYGLYPECILIFVYGRERIRTNPIGCGHHKETASAKIN